MTQEALKLALEGLEEWRFGGDPRAADKYITAIKEVLAQSTSGDYALGYSIGFGDGHSAAKALAQPEQEPTLQEQFDKALHSLDFYRRRINALQEWQSKMRDPERTIVCDIIANGHTLEPAGDRYITPPQLEERNFCPRCGKRTKDIHTCTPPQRTWVGLTDEEIAQGCKESWVTEQAWQSAVWWAEAKLKEKNT